MQVPVKKRISQAESARGIGKRLWPQGPLAAVLILVGILNVVSGLKLPLPVFLRTHAVSDLAESLSALGGTMQAISGLWLAVAGVGLLWRLVAAWTLAVLLLLVMLGINIVRSEWGVHFVLEALVLGALFFLQTPVHAPDDAGQFRVVVERDSCGVDVWRVRQFSARQRVSAADS